MKILFQSLRNILRKSRPSRNTPLPSRKVRLGFECLEDRQLLSTTALGALSHGTALTALTTSGNSSAQASSHQVARDGVSLAAALASNLDDKSGVMNVNPNDVTFPDPRNGSFDVFVDNEEIRVDSTSGSNNGTTTFSVTRGVNGTTAAAHAQGSAVILGSTAHGTSAPGVFVNFSGAVWEHVGTDKNAGWFKIWGAGITEMSASTTQADTVFLLFGGSAGGAVWEHVGRDSNTGWSKIWAAGVTEISAGVDSFGAPAVFCNFSGAVWEHTGTDSNTGWSKIWTTSITQISASQHQANTVFTLFGGSVGGAVWEHAGMDLNSGWSKVWDAGVTEISASSAQDDTVFCNFSGTVWEHNGTDKNAGWSKIWSPGITQMSASPVQADTVFLLFGGSVGGAAWEHNGTDLNTGWSKVWDTAITQISAAPVQNDTAYVLFGSGAVWEHVGTDRNAGWFKIWDSGITAISAGLSES